MTSPDPVLSAATTVPLSAALRERTREAHERAETSTFVVDLLRGHLGIEAYADLAAQHHAIYSALERAAAGWVGDPVAGRIVSPELARVAALEHDLAALLGSGWRASAATLMHPATVGYVARIRTVAAADPAAFVAHHYVRYLGDLSGGQVVGRRVGEIYGDTGRRAREFYRFDGVDVVPFRAHYRARLDAAPLTPAARDTLLAEAALVFDLNRAVFAGLAARHPG